MKAPICKYCGWPIRKLKDENDWITYSGKRKARKGWPKAPVMEPFTDGSLYWYVCLGQDYEIIINNGHKPEDAFETMARRRKDEMDRARKQH